MRHPTDDRLQDFAEGLLSGPDGGVVAAHLEVCEPCRSTVDAVRNLRAQAGGLPRQVEPPAELWDRIRSRIESPTTGRTEPPRGPRDSRIHWRPGPGRTRLHLAAAAVILVVLSSGMTLWLAGRGGVGTDQLPSASAPSSPFQMVSSAEQLEAGYGPAIRELEEIAFREGGRLAPETMAVIRESLALIDQAIREAQEALEADPSSLSAAGVLNGHYETKVQVLRQVAILTQGI